MILRSPVPDNGTGGFFFQGGTLGLVIWPEGGLGLLKRDEESLPKINACSAH